MSRNPGTLPAGDACIYCTAWRYWGTQGVSRDGSSAIRRETVGQCRANPPTISRQEVGSTNAEWPVVGAEDWCRSFTPMGEAHSAEEAA